MKSLGDNIKFLKKKIQKENEEYQEIKKILRKFLKETFPGKDTSQYIKSFYVKKRTLYLETTRKIFAQEINFYKLELLKKLSQFVREIRIK